MSDRRFSPRSPAVKLGAYAVILGLALGGGALVGATVGPDADDTETAAMSDVMAMPVSPSDQLPGGLAISRDGYTLDLRTPVVEAGPAADLVFVIDGPDARPVTDYTVEHDKELHLVIVRRDLTGYAHVHPTRDTEGRWTVTAPAMTPGPYRVFADFTPAGGEGLTLGADLTVPGDYQPNQHRGTSRDRAVDGYDVSFDGELVAGTESELTVTVSRDGFPVTDLQPYLGALGHLVAIRDGDLAYLHVHPLDETGGAGGPEVRFAVEVPTAGSYGLFFDFSHAGNVRTASAFAAATPDVDTSHGDAPSGDHDTHGG